MISRIIKYEVCARKPKAEVDNSNRGLDNSRYHAKTEFNNCFTMYSKTKKRTIQMEHTKISCQVNSSSIFFNVLSIHNVFKTIK